MTLLEYQIKFAKMVKVLLGVADALGYDYTFGHALRCCDCKVGNDKSLHKDKLAIDLNLFYRGAYLTETDSYRTLGEFWESIGGSWGGRFNDGNHFSLMYQNRK